ncbi:DUF3853 family protein [Apibacter muscae]|uniref:DUF3853 family protein n=1 Tax=Apibacter muscae TaxID=2509004 RepID=UPI0011AC8E5E|nr:DUF3853 family protein [Apibacter muscae]TWP24279.1 DUF3853 family protein [Apibacter muscae]TWP30160.1 DUF3853 family protein [Apibacter muscae]
MKQVNLEVNGIDFKNLKVNGVSLQELFQKLENLTHTKTQEKNATESETHLLLTRKEVAHLLKISLPTLHDWTKKGLIKSYRIGNRVRYKQTDLYNALQKTSQQ